MDLALPFTWHRHADLIAPDTLCAKRVLMFVLMALGMRPPLVNWNAYMGRSEPHFTISSTGSKRSESGQLD